LPLPAPPMLRIISSRPDMPPSCFIMCGGIMFEIWARLGWRPRAPPVGTYRGTPRAPVSRGTHGTHTRHTRTHTYPDTGARTAALLGESAVLGEQLVDVGHRAAGATRKTDDSRLGVFGEHLRLVQFWSTIKR
jgi:hypothetical protein